MFKKNREEILSRNLTVKGWEKKQVFAWTHDMGKVTFCCIFCFVFFVGETGHVQMLNESLEKRC